MNLFTVVIMDNTLLSRLTFVLPVVQLCGNGLFSVNHCTLYFAADVRLVISSSLLTLEFRHCQWSFSPLWDFRWSPSNRLISMSHLIYRSYSAALFSAGWMQALNTSSLRLQWCLMAFWSRLEVCNGGVMDYTVWTGESLYQTLENMHHMDKKHYTETQ